MTFSMNSTSQAIQAHKRILERASRIKQTRIKEHAKTLTTTDLNELKNAGRK